MSTAQGPSAVKQALLQKVREEIVPELEQLVLGLPDQLVDFGEAEVELRQGFIKLARHLLDLWAHRADTKIARPCCPTCGVPMRNLGFVKSEVVTTVGGVRYRRPRWRCHDCHQECYPHDAVLRFRSHGVSWPLAKVASRLAAQIPSPEEAGNNLAEDYGVHLAKETVRQIAEAAGNTLLQQEDEQRRRVMEREAPLPDSDKKPDQAYVFADGTTVHSEGDWHEIRVATVATEDAAGNPLERQSRARFMDVEQTAWTLVMLARRAGYQNAKQRAFIADGAAWLWKLQAAFFANATPILDGYHLAEHVHKAANELHGPGTAEAQQWARRIKDELWEGRVDNARSWTQQELARARSPSKREALQELLTYLENNQQHMDYPRYRALRLPVGSGQVEAQCKTLVGARCKQAGMRNWYLESGEKTMLPAVFGPPPTIKVPAS
jgi:transposase